MIDKENHEAGFHFWRIGVTFCWKTDVIDILPNVRLCFGYIAGIYDREAMFQFQWITFSLFITFKYD